MKIRLMRSLAGCIPLLGVFTFTACEDKQGQAEMQRLRTQLQTVEETATAAAAEAESARRILKDARNQLDEEKNRSRSELESLRQKVEDTTKEFEGYKEKFRISARKNAPGREIARLECGNDQVFTDVKIIALNPGELRFSHASGVTTVPLGRLHEDVRAQFAYSPEEAVAWLAAEEGKAAAKSAEAEEALLSQAKPGGKTKFKGKYSGPGLTSAGARSASLRAGYERRLKSLYASARALQADNTGCPVHKRYQLASWASQAGRLKKQLASLPSS